MLFRSYTPFHTLPEICNNSLGSYYKFLVKYEKEYTIRLTSQQEKFVEYISRKFASGKRVHELELLNQVLRYKTGIFARLQKRLEDKYKISVSEKTRVNIKNIMTNEFTSGSGKGTYSECIFIEKDGEDYRISETFEKALGDNNFYLIVKEIIDFGLDRYKKNYSKRYMDTNLQLYQKYTYEDVCRLLEWEKGEVALNIGGYRYDKRTKTYPVFINYHKDQEIQEPA